ncbi:type III secretion system stator protein SctL [Pseudomonas capsici]|uniref:type III secretion system stator protein SctL n=1 Tax=Pseudomonas capsici TaxID=2810614 RepID=UPI0021F10928|nr:type III secretion system stator protein SctL [Pseudomonas capsici]MCV4343941.1 type III secretion system stator protein SctL [Pseudomonas capsici]
MLTSRSLTLTSNRSTVNEPLLRREVLEQSLLAEELLEDARAQAREILDTAEAEAEALRQRCEEQTRAEVWQQAQSLLDDLREQRERTLATVVEAAEDLVQQALQLVLGELSDGQKVSAVLRQLTSASPNEESALIYCHPDRITLLAQSLEEQGQLGWTLRGDPNLEPDAISLRTEHGDFSLSWNALQRHVWP